MYSQKWISKLTIKKGGNYSAYWLNSNCSNQYQLLHSKKDEQSIAFMSLFFIRYKSNPDLFLNLSGFSPLDHRTGTGNCYYSRDQIFPCQSHFRNRSEFDKGKIWWDFSCLLVFINIRFDNYLNNSNSLDLSILPAFFESNCPGLILYYLTCFNKFIIQCNF